MNIVTRAQAMHIHRQHPGAQISKFDRGRYVWHGRSADYLGKRVTDIPGVLAVFAVRRQDNHGPYAALMAVSERAAG